MPVAAAVTTLAARPVPTGGRVAQLLTQSLAKSGGPRLAVGCPRALWSQPLAECSAEAQLLRSYYELPLDSLVALSALGVRKNALLLTFNICHGNLNAIETALR